MLNFQSPGIGVLSIVLTSFFLGAIPSGFIIGKLWGVDVRKRGSGNIGATNVNRLVGRTAGALTLLLDLLKGVLATFLPELIGHAYVPGGAATAGICAVIGHCFSPFMLFQGGKGVATALGVFLSLAPGAAFWGIVAFLITVGFWRFVSLGSLVGVWVATGLIITKQFGSYHSTVELAALVISSLVTIRHHANIRRLMNGTEHRFRR